MHLADIYRCDDKHMNEAQDNRAELAYQGLMDAAAQPQLTAFLCEVEERIGVKAMETKLGIPWTSFRT